MKEENKKRINKLMVPLTLKSVSLFSAFTMITTGMSGCKKVDKNDTSSLNNDITTADTSEIENNQTDTTTEIDSNKVNTTSEIEISSSKEDTSKTENNVSSSKNSSKKPSTSNSQITSNNSSISQPSNLQTTTPSTPSSSSEENVTIFEPLTEQNINDVEKFKQGVYLVAKDTRGNFGGIWTYYYNNQKYQTWGVPEPEFSYVLAGLNYDYMSETVLSQIFGNYSLDDLKRFNCIIDLLAGAIEAQDRVNDWSRLIINKEILEDLTKMEHAYLNYHKGKGKEELKELLISGPKSNNKIVRRYFFLLCADYFRDDHSEDNKYYSLYLDSYYNDYVDGSEQFAAELYNKSHSKTKVLN